MGVNNTQQPRILRMDADNIDLSYDRSHKGKSPVGNDRYLNKSVRVARESIRESISPLVRSPASKRSPAVSRRNSATSEEDLLVPNPNRKIFRRSFVAEKSTSTYVDTIFKVNSETTVSSFMKALGNGTVSHSAILLYWRDKSALSTHKFKTFLSGLLRTAEASTAYRRNCLYCSLRRHLKILSKEQKTLCMSIVFQKDRDVSPADVLNKRCKQRVHQILALDDEDNVFLAQGLVSSGVEICNGICSIPKLLRAKHVVEDNAVSVVEHIGHFVFYCQSVVHAPDLLSKLSVTMLFLGKYQISTTMAHKFATALAQATIGLVTHKLVAQGITKEDIMTKEQVGETLFGGMVTLVTNMFGVKTPIAINADAMRLKRINGLVMGLSNIKKAYDMLHGLFQVSVDYMLSYVTGVPRSWMELERIEKDIPAWIKDVAEAYEDFGLVRASSDVAFARNIKDLYKKGQEYLKLVKESKCDARLLSGLNYTFRTVEKMLDETQSLYGHDTVRPTPLLVFIRGKPGIGKSTLVYFLARELCMDMDIPFNAGDMYVRNGSQDHWDGYRNQSLVWYDDYLQSQLDEVKNRELLDMLAIKNLTPLPLKMADLSSKGNTRFTSPLVVMTTNSDLHNNHNIADIEAMRRRRDLNVTISVKPEFCLPNSDKLDVEKACEFNKKHGIRAISKFGDEYTPEFCKYVYNIHVYSSTDVGSKGENLVATFEWDEFVQYALVKWRRLRQSDEMIVKDTEAIFKSLPDDGGYSFKDDSPEEQAEILIDYDLINIKKIESHFKNRPDRLASWRSLMEEIDSEGYPLSKAAWGRACTYVPVSPDDLANILRSYANIKISNTTKCSKMMEVAREHFAGWMENVKSSFQKVEWFSASQTCLAAFAAGAALCMLRHYTLSHPKDVGETFSSGDDVTKHVKRKVIPRKYVAKTESTFTSGDGPDDDIITEGSADSQALNIGNSITTTNMARVTIDSTFDGRSMSSTMNGIFVKGTCIMLPSHILSFIEENDTSTTLSLRTRADIVEGIPLHKCAVYVDLARDVALINIPSHYCGRKRDIIRHFAAVNDRTRSNFSSGMLFGMQEDGNSLNKVLWHLPNVKSKGPTKYDLAGDSTVKYEIMDAYVYSTDTSGGDCGAMLIWHSPRVNAKIIGFHVAGSSEHGVASAISREDVEDMLKQLEETEGIKIIGDEHPLYSATDSDIEQGLVSQMSNASFCGRVRPQHQLSMAPKSGIRKSPLYEKMYKAVTKPAMLRRKDGIDPVKNGVVKTLTESVILDERYLEYALGDYEGVVLSLPTKNRVRRLLTVHEALNGIFEDKYVQPMNMKTSPGFPYVQEKRGSLRGKLAYVTCSDGEIIPGEILEQRINYRIDRAKKYIIPHTLFCDTLKDERLPLEKAQSGRTRFFNVAPFDFNICVRMYFGMFIASMMENHLYSECSVGINVHSRDWGTFYKRFVAMPGKWIAGDYSNYDKSLNRGSIYGCVDIINRWYGGSSEDNQIRKVLAITMFEAYHLVGREVYLVNQGNPSGVAITSIINCMVNSVLVRYVYFSLMAEQDIIYDITSFNENVKQANYGDDNIIRVSDDIPWFNMRAVSEAFAKVGIKYTTSSKTEDIPIWVDDDDLTYLKRGFRSDRFGNVFAPLSRDSIHELVNWIRNSCPPIEALSQNIRDAKKEMFHYGKEELLKFTHEVDRLCGLYGLPVTYLPYDHLFQQWSSGSDMMVVCKTPIITPKACETNHLGSEQDLAPD